MKASAPTPHATHLARLRPAFGNDGVLTAGNSSQLSDGAAMLVLASAQAVEQHGLKPIARILGGSWHAVTPWRFVEGPIPAVQKLADKLGMKVTDFDLFENNEAFALNNVLFQQSLGLSADIVNVYGGGIALGHPIGASGARIIVTLLSALRQEGARQGYRLALPRSRRWHRSGNRIVIDPIALDGDQPSAQNGGVCTQMALQRR